MDTGGDNASNLQIPNRLLHSYTVITATELLCSVQNRERLHVNRLRVMDWFLIIEEKSLERKQK